MKLNYSLLGISTTFLACSLSYAENIYDDQLDTIEVNAEQQVGSQYKSADVTGLGRVKKSIEKLQQEQVENVRDLTRYDPDISVNEAGGRGTSRGFSMRGVEKERIAIDVDGLTSAPILRRDDPTAGKHRVFSSSASINEVEYENLKEVDLRRGSSSAESGSGALGGSVRMVTKDAADFFANEDDKFAGRIKTGYTSKDGRKTVSLAVAGRHNGIEGFLQYTKRKGHEVRSHNDLYKSGGGEIRYYSPAANATLINTHLNAKEISGEGRKVPNPLEYTSDSFLSKVGYHFNSSHYAGLVIDYTTQTYALRDMFLPNYWHPRSDDYPNLFDFESVPDIVLPYTPARFYIDQHKNNRLGLEYKYTASNQAAIFDSVFIRLDRRKLSLQSEALTLNCSTWPSIDKNCWPSDTNYQRGMLGDRHVSKLTERDIRSDISLAKSFHTKSIQHQFQVKTGVINSTYIVDNFWQKTQNLEKSAEENRKNETHYFTYGPHSTGEMKGKNIFITLSDRIGITDNFSVSLTGRYDYQKYSANPTADQQKVGITFAQAKYNNISWDFGLAYQPTRYLNLTYRLSSGFRNPSIIELIGPGFNNERFNANSDKQGSLSTEKSLNNEIGLEFSSEPVNILASYFVTRYQDIIGRAAIYYLNADGSVDSTKTGYATSDLYFNLYNFTTHGFDIKTTVDTHSVWNKFPEGLLLKANVGVTKIKKMEPIPAKFGIASSYSFDAIQPLRVIYGIEYYAPSEKWGISILNTYSKGKDLSELLSSSRQNTLNTVGARVAKIKTRSWRTTDLTGYYKFKDLTLRAGIYNLFNYRYVTWESARQTALGTEARQSTNNYSVLAAPGRNFYLSAEFKF
ncbi:TonB-dependent hemoglobin/transferrin/lactoferrin family receptor [Gallibacterium trehalosifermentans]|uniref:TonB-dependent hemoglobin/transferrin/lactoferrin family receptor n=1 Tax=Gallibacterium trehalosifermentans TaxID=516935 RepID=A0ABV6H4D2_9PAST